jgi:hypothetical protein
MNQSSQAPPEATSVAVEPGVCGFHCTVRAEKSTDGKIRVFITDSKCELVQKMSEFIEAFSLKELFLPLTKNPIYQWAERARCHPSCIVPFAILKAVEVEAGMALPRGAAIEFREQKT